MSSKETPDPETAEKEMRLACLRMATESIMATRFTHDYEDIPQAILNAAKGFEEYVIKTAAS